MTKPIHIPDALRERIAHAGLAVRVERAECIEQAAEVDQLAYAPSTEPSATRVRLVADDLAALDEQHLESGPSSADAGPSHTIDTHEPSTTLEMATFARAGIELESIELAHLRLVVASRLGDPLRVVGDRQLASALDDDGTRWRLELGGGGDHFVALLHETDGSGMTLVACKGRVVVWEEFRSLDVALPESDARVAAWVDEAPADLKRALEMRACDPMLGELVAVAALLRHGAAPDAAREWCMDLSAERIEHALQSALALAGSLTDEFDELLEATDLDDPGWRTSVVRVLEEREALACLVDGWPDAAPWTVLVDLLRDAVDPEGEVFVGSLLTFDDAAFSDLVVAGVAAFDREQGVDAVLPWWLTPATWIEP